MLYQKGPNHNPELYHHPEPDPEYIIPDPQQSVKLIIIIIWTQLATLLPDCLFTSIGPLKIKLSTSTSTVH
jgi:hypothetical protein